MIEYGKGTQIIGVIGFEGVRRCRNWRERGVLRRKKLY